MGKSINKEIMKYNYTYIQTHMYKKIQIYAHTYRERQK